MSVASRQYEVLRFVFVISPEWMVLCCTHENIADLHSVGRVPQRSCDGGKGENRFCPKT